MASTTAIEGRQADAGRIPAALAPVAYLGELAGVAGAAVRALVRPRGSAPPLGAAVIGRLDVLFGWGLPIVGLIHVSLGSFLAMQAYFGATFREASGAVVGIGLVRNVATLVTGFVLAGLQAGWIVPELRRRPRLGLDGDPLWVPDRDVSRGLRHDDRPEADPGRLTAVRVLAAGVAGPVLAFWGAAVGLGFGLMVAQGKLSVAPGVFLGKFLERAAAIDMLGLVVKGAAFAMVGALLACHEGLRGRDEPEAVRVAALRAVVLTIVGILVINGSWFTAMYLAGSPFGPELVEP